MTDDPRPRDPRLVEYGELPELTRGLRALGSARRSPGSLHTLFFMPLIDARRRAAEARSATHCLGAFDPTELARALDRVMERMIAEWPDERPSAKRALKTRMLERVAEYTRALEVLREHAASVMAADEDTRLVAWRAWTTQLAATFDAADRSWVALRAVMDTLPSRPGRERI